MLRDAFSYPLETSRRQLAFGLLLAFLSPLVVPLLVLIGYCIRVLGDPGSEPPAFRPWKDLIVDGGKTVVIASSWFFTPMVFVGLFYAMVFHHHLGEQGPHVMFLSLFYYGTYFYSLPAILGRFARTGRLKEGFNVPAIAPIWMEPEYRKRSLVGIGVSAVGVVGTTVFVGLTGGLGVVAVPVVAFWTGLALSRLYADGIDGGAAAS